LKLRPWRGATFRFYNLPLRSLESCVLWTCVYLWEPSSLQPASQRSLLVAAAEGKTTTTITSTSTGLVNPLIQTAIESRLYNRKDCDSIDPFQTVHRCVSQCRCSAGRARNLLHHPNHPKKQKTRTTMYHTKIVCFHVSRRLNRQLPPRRTAGNHHHDFKFVKARHRTFAI
jgi:hypothetical protein